MSTVPAGLVRRATDTVTVAGFRIGWTVIRRMPERAAYAFFDRIADLTVARGGGARLRANYATVRPELDDAELDALVREGMRAYMRYYCEAFRLPVLTPDELAARVRVEGDGPVREVLDADGSLVCFLGHMGNWDLAGAWGAVHLGPVTTVAERLKPEEVFEEFLAFRTGLGMTIHPLTGGPAPFPLLRQAARRRGLIPLLSDRDLSRDGVEVEFCGEPARMAAGPAALALAERRPLFPVSIRHEQREGGGWGIVITFHEPVVVPPSGTTRERVSAMTQACADALGSAVRTHTADWHMLQPVFTKDLDVERLARVGAR
ncbi:phosphatidylinositol mannoside acyltransferase [Knoellia subterranea]|uniref:Lipid A biosynthesis acyltransferase n=1 Tax=Knoellia subterranea KCTC 19937 TaxID=1385521 RepID=A0A0A0JSK3_9MICO|nr:phosphatidylinositol mannoside acyltransferase [Knoellia subterranea]KGN38596.1 lipid A biosynthesis acyltransferase [Knoellia subterranea KCTC 19937]